MLDQKEKEFNDLEAEIDEFTTNVEQNMIKICDHEDILNEEIENLKQSHSIQF